MKLYNVEELAALKNVSVATARRWCAEAWEKCQPITGDTLEPVKVNNKCWAILLPEYPGEHATIKKMQQDRKACT